MSQLLTAYLAHVQFQFHLSVVNCLEWKHMVVLACFMYATHYFDTHYTI